MNLLFPAKICNLDCCFQHGKYVYSDAYGGLPVSGFSEPNSQDQNLRNRTSSHCMCWPKFLGADARLMRTMVPYQDSPKIYAALKGLSHEMDLGFDDMHGQFKA